jgi:peptidoglycan hydrolase-like protein with peptidoglycan-binding domain
MITGFHLGASATGPAAQLQKALRVLGQTTGDPTLSGLKVDGVVGPNTTKAVNYAFATYGGSTKTDWTLQDVRTKAPTLAMMVESVVRQRGGSIAKPKAKHVATPMSSIPTVAAEPEPERRWIWWAVGGASVLLVLAMAASAVKKHRHGAAAEA